MNTLKPRTSHIAIAVQLIVACMFLLTSVCAAHPGQATAAEQPSACAAQPFCFDTTHFAATVTTFRTSVVNGYKIIDASIHFQNKTKQPLVIGYVNQSGFATDDRGNRSIVGGPNGYRGIGLVNGNSFDPKLIIRPAGTGDVQFELFLQGTPQIIGFHYALDITVAEIKTLEGSQYLLDGEFPLHFEGLTNGISQGAGSLSAAPASAANAISNLKSLFGKKKGVQNTAAATNSAANTVAAANTAANAASAQSAAAAANTLSQATGGVAAQTATKVPSPNGASAARAVQQGTSANAPSPQALSAAPAESSQPQARPTTSPTAADLRGAALADSDPDPNLGTAKVAVSASKYDVLGIKLGMPAKDAMAILKAHGQYQTTPETIKYDFLSAPMTYGVMAANAVVVRNGGRVIPESEKLYFVVTMPPNQPIISKISRYLMFSKDTAPTAESLVSDLTKKYGTPSYDSHVTDLYASPGYRELFWVDDSQGHRLLNQMEPNGGYSNQINNCRSVSTFSFPGANPADPNIQVDSVRIKQELEQGYTTQYPAMYGCANLTIIYAKLIYGYPIGVSAHDVAGGLLVVMGSAPLDHTAADASRAYLAQAAKNRDLAQKQKAQKNKPAL
jgi:hypothetical protein